MHWQNRSWADSGGYRWLAHGAFWRIDRFGGQIGKQNAIRKTIKDTWQRVSIMRER